jgi:hypothetical protein
LPGWVDGRRSVQGVPLDPGKVPLTSVEQLPPRGVPFRLKVTTELAENPVPEAEMIAPDAGPSLRTEKLAFTKKLRLAVLTPSVAAMTWTPPGVGGIAKVQGVPLYPGNSPSPSVEQLEGTGIPATVRAMFDHVLKLVPDAVTRVPTGP